MKIIAECYATAGYGTSSYNEKTNECKHKCYASIDKIISNKKYWKQYDDMMSDTLNTDFSMGFNFNTFRLVVFDDGTKQANEVDRSDVFRRQK